MKLLLDTCTLIWLAEDHPNLSQPAKLAIANKNNQCFVSIATFWEIAIKIKKGTLQITIPFEDLKALIVKNNIEILSITFEHTQLITGMPFHHKDPFDRLLIAQAMNEEMTLLSKDENFPKYNIKIIW